MAAPVNVIDKYRIDAVTATPLHIGNGEKDSGDVLVHPVTDLPFIQAAGIAGALRDISVRINKGDITEELFGKSVLGEKDSPADYGSKLKISDGIFKKHNMSMEFRPRVAIDPKTGTVSNAKIAGSGHSAGHKFDVELIAAGSEFQFFLYLFHQSGDQMKDALERVLGGLAAEELQIGGQKNNGNGFISLKKVNHAAFDMTKEEDRKAWQMEYGMDMEGTGTQEGVKTYQDIMESLKGSASLHAETAYKITVTGKTEGPLLVKGIAAASFGEGEPDAENIRNAAGKYIVPGSSLKGALRSRAAYLGKVLKKEKMVERFFGRAISSREAKEQGMTGERGIITVRDVILDTNVHDVLQHRIHVDKFTGGVINGALFAEKTITGDITMKITVADRRQPDAAAGLLLLVLRDLANGAFNIGSGYHIGHGFIEVHQVVIEDVRNHGQAAIDFTEIGKDGGNQGPDDPEKIISGCLKAVAEWKEQ